SRIARREMRLRRLTAIQGWQLHSRRFIATIHLVAQPVGQMRPPSETPIKSIASRHLRSPRAVPHWHALDDLNQSLTQGGTDVNPGPLASLKGTDRPKGHGSPAQRQGSALGVVGAFSGPAKVVGGGAPHAMHIKRLPIVAMITAAVAALAIVTVN